MRMLLIHADSMSYEVKELALREAEDVSEGQRRASYKNVLVVFTTVEDEDANAIESVVEGAAREIANVLGNVGADMVLLYPYAHLSSKLASPKDALEVLRRLEEKLRIKGIKAARAPFGWYKAFVLSCKGHPLSELSKTISPDVEVLQPSKLKTREGVEEGYYVLIKPDGGLIELNRERPYNDEAVKLFPLIERLIMNERGLKTEKGAPPHIRFMQKLELVDYELASDVGHFKFLPKGALVKYLLEELAMDIAINDLGAVVVETPMIYRLSVPEIAEQASRFLERDYRFKIDNEEFTLRFAGDFGLFSMMKKVALSYKQLPLRVYELSHSFRLEKRGECVGLRRLRSFTMPDVHCFCADLEQGKEEFANLLKKYMKLVKSMMIDYVIVFRAVEEFFKSNREWFASIAKEIEEPVLVEVLPTMKHYWVVKEEHQFIDSLGGNAQLCTVQLDVEDSERYDIKYVDKDNKKRGCIIVHSSMGSIERWMYAILEQAEKNRMAGKPPMLPVWLSPIQVRIIPVSSEYISKAVEIANVLEGADIRVDVDDRDESVPKKIREAEIEWIPYIVVIGEKEVKEGVLSVRVRAKRETVTMTLNELVNLVSSECKDKPKAKLWLPRMLSRRPKFI
ncbi:MAG: threonine--tRNA ligase [Candidatus Nezhaarchaeota archaeon]|nr:threonine--tRNA ligase [Candidatus Nezhaarchaeota archaeon]MCX8141568.1 threonine--tRNA ligase [Candidatus Nezhaarchaeota archaeon]MDW8049835.1 threonine--tRNA ligase [Nitrososphaerota archaeon]